MVYITGTAQHPVWKFLKFLLVVMLILAVLAGYLYMHPDIWQQWVKGTPLEPSPTITKTYKWRNEQGEWQITDRPPKGDVEYEIQIYNSNTNIVPSLETPEEKK